MKASLTFRDEKNPLVRMKFPVTLAGFSLTSGIVLGDNQDLSLHLGTSSEACPSVKIAYRPNLSSSFLSLVVKAGIGPWGPPRASSLSLAAEVRFSGVVSGPLFTVHVKPRLGDFSLRKMAKIASFGALTETPTPRMNKQGHSRSQTLSQSLMQSHSRSFHDTPSEALHAVPTVDETSYTGIFDDEKIVKKDISESTRGLFGDAAGLTPLHLDKNSLFTPMPYRGQPLNRMHDVISEEAESVDNWGNDYVKVEGFDRSNGAFQEEDIHIIGKGRDDCTSNVEIFGDQQLHSESPLCTSGGGVSCINEPDSASIIKTIDFFPVPWRWGVDESSRGWNLHAHTSLPLGSHSALKFRWGVSAHHDFLQGWDSQLSSFKLPYLSLQKVSILSTGVALESCKQGDFHSGAQLPSLLQYEQIHELSPVAALCGSMKRQLQLLYAENQVLKKAMEEMKAQFEQRSSINQRGLAGNLGDIFAEEAAGDPAEEANEDFREAGVKKYQKNGGAGSKRDNQSHSHDGVSALKRFTGLGRGRKGNNLTVY